MFLPAGLSKECHSGIRKTAPITKKGNPECGLWSHHVSRPIAMLPVAIAAATAISLPLFFCRDRLVLQKGSDTRYSRTRTNLELVNTIGSTLSSHRKKGAYNHLMYHPSGDSLEKYFVSFYDYSEKQVVNHRTPMRRTFSTKKGCMNGRFQH